MRLENTLALINAKLLNKPSIELFDTICFELKKVRRGDLFIAYKNSDIPQAIAQGAYGIIFENTQQISDTEIAWMQVESVEDALLRLLRFHLIDRDVTAYDCDLITLELASKIQTNSKIVVTESSLRNSYNKLHEVEVGSTVLFNSSCIKEDLFVNIKPFVKIATEHINIIEQTLFETSFIYDNVFYERQLLSPFFIPFLELLFQFYKSENIIFSLKDFSSLEHFKPVFTDSKLQSKDFGASNKVLIFEPSFELISTQINFLNAQASWAKIIYIVPRVKARDLEDDINIFAYESEEEILDILINEQFHFALIAEKDKSLLNLVKERHRPKQQLTLI